MIFHIILLLEIWLSRRIVGITSTLDILFLWKWNVSIQCCSKSDWLLKNCDIPVWVYFKTGVSFNLNRCSYMKKWTNSNRGSNNLLGLVHSNNSFVWQPPLFLLPKRISVLSKQTFKNWNYFFGNNTIFWEIQKMWGSFI